jgi:hypothetical protein
LKSCLGTSMSLLYLEVIAQYLRSVRRKAPEKYWGFLVPDFPLGTKRRIFNAGKSVPVPSMTTANASCRLSRVAWVTCAGGCSKPNFEPAVNLPQVELIPEDPVALTADGVKRVNGEVVKADCAHLPSGLVS